MPGEAFMDTMMVNGTAYPYLDIEPKTYRFRVLNAANDRFLNLSLYQASTGIVGSLTNITAGSGTRKIRLSLSPTHPEIPRARIHLVCHGRRRSGQPDPRPGLLQYPHGWQQLHAPAVITVTPADGEGSGALPRLCSIPPLLKSVWSRSAGLTGWPPFDASGVPDQSMAGPSWITDRHRGRLPACSSRNPAQADNLEHQPHYVQLRNVNGSCAVAGPAERADVLVDFSAYAGKTLILYNDAPAAFPPRFLPMITTPTTRI